MKCVAVIFFVGFFCMCESGNTTSIPLNVSFLSFIELQARARAHDTSALLHAAHIGDLYWVNELTKTKKTVNVHDSKGQTALHQAVKMNRDRVVQLLLNKKADAEAKDIHGCTPFHWAAASGSNKCIEILLASRVNSKAITSTGQTALHLAISNHRLQTIPLLIQIAGLKSAGDENGDTPLHYAAQWLYSEALTFYDFYPRMMTDSINFNTHIKYKSRECLKTLIINGASQQAKNNKELTFANTKNIDGSTPVHFAAEENDVELLLLLINNQADLNIKNDKGIAPLHSAAMHNSHECLDMLIKHGACVDERDGEHNTSLHLAALAGSTACVITLIKSGANIDATNKRGETPLHFASYHNHHECIDVLIASGATLDIINSIRKTPLYIAAQQGDAETIGLLVENKAQRTLPDSRGKTPVSFICERGKKDLIEALIAPKKIYSLYAPLSYEYQKVLARFNAVYLSLCYAECGEKTQIYITSEGVKVVLKIMNDAGRAIARNKYLQLEIFKWLKFDTIKLCLYKLAHSKPMRHPLLLSRKTKKLIISYILHAMKVTCHRWIKKRLFILINPALQTLLEPKFVFNNYGKAVSKSITHRLKELAETNSSNKFISNIPIS